MYMRYQEAKKTFLLITTSKIIAASCTDDLLQRRKFMVKTILYIKTNV